MAEPIHEAGLYLLRHPVRPLLSITEFIMYTGGFDDVHEVLALLPESIETETALYTKAQQHLKPYTEELERFQPGKADESKDLPVILDEEENPLEPATALSALLNQRILEKELEKINSLLCGAHACTLCCTGPDEAMQQQYFDIPLSEGEEALFPGLDWLQTAQKKSAAMRSLETMATGLAGARRGAVLARHRQGTSLVLPKLSRCPALDNAGRCSMYEQRPQVCRKPQIFPYLLEKERACAPDGKPILRLRNTLLAVMDCPYVQQLQDDIALYAAASELKLVFRRNKA